MNRIYLVILIFFAAMFVFADDVGTDVLQCGTNDFSPYGFMEGGELKGIEVDLLREIARRLGLKIEIKLYPWQRLLEYSKNGRLDCMFAAFKTEERLKYMDYANFPIHVSSLVLYVNEDRPVAFNRLVDLKGLRIGLMRGFKTSPDFDIAVADGWFRLDESDTFDQLFSKLSKRRVELVLANHHVGQYHLKKLKLTNVVTLPKPLAATSAYIAFSKRKNLSHLIPQFDYVLFQIMSDCTYQQIMKKYIEIR